MSSSAFATALPSEVVKITTDPITEQFWLEAKSGRLVIPKCSNCGHFRMPPTPFCPACQSKAVKWTESSGFGSIYSFAVVHGYPGHPDIVLVPVVVELDDAPGVRLVSNLIDVDPETVEIGQRLKVDFHPITDGWSLPIFRRLEEGATSE